MSAFDDLERQLRGGVRRAHRPARRPWWRPPALALIAGLVIAGGALAATGTIRIGPVHDDLGPRFTPTPHSAAGVRAGPAKTLALRVADPAGGPPWTLRVFASTRAASCVQVGQVVRGHFGVFVAPGTLEPLRAWPGGVSSLCSGEQRAGFPVVRGLERTRVVGGPSDPRRCPAGSTGDCPITSVTLLRYGLLGPGARSVRLLDADGRTLAMTTTNPGIGGAYLFAVAQPVGPYVQAAQHERAIADAEQRAAQQARARGASAFAAVRDVSRAMRARLRGTLLARPPVVSVRAMFADGSTLRVAGKGRSHAALPGVGTRPPARHAPLPRDVPVHARVNAPGRFATVVLSFRAPRAIGRFDVHYTSTLHGRTGSGCDDATGGYEATTGDIAARQIVRLTMRRRGILEDGRRGWCPGRFTGEIRYSTPARNIVIGHYAFKIR
jgi:hypothetical protein